jgi:hypothetical protein
MKSESECIQRATCRSKTVRVCCVLIEITTRSVFTLYDMVWKKVILHRSHILISFLLAY